MVSSFEDICQVIDSVREEGRASRGESLPHRVLTHLYDKLHESVEHPVVAAFLSDCVEAVHRTPDFGRTRDAVMAHDRDLILGMFAASYNPRLDLEGLVYQREWVEPRLASLYPHDGVRPISVLAATGGFRHALSVALFAENFVTPESVADRHRAYYFVDRFARRFWQITRPILLLCTAPASFARLKRASQDEIKRASTAWVHLHEHFHRLGFLPLPAYLGLKSSRSAAGLEEVRCDVLSIISVLKEWRAGLPDGDLYAEFILAERLIRYPLQDDPQVNYDTRGAQFLYGFLQKRGVLREQDGFLELSRAFSEVVDALRELVVSVNRIEYAISRDAQPRGAHDHRTRMVKELGGYDADSDEFRLLPFFVHARAVARRARIPLLMEY